MHPHQPHWVFYAVLTQSGREPSSKKPQVAQNENAPPARERRGRSFQRTAHLAGRGHAPCISTDKGCQRQRLSVIRRGFGRHADGRSSPPAESGRYVCGRGKVRRRRGEKCHLRATGRGPFASQDRLRMLGRSYVTIGEGLVLFAIAWSATASQCHPFPREVRLRPATPSPKQTSWDRVGEAGLASTASERTLP
jgi:hypothetical protein